MGLISSQPRSEQISANRTHLCLGIYLHAGPEIGVASTKAFSAQLIILSLFALKVTTH